MKKILLITASILGILVIVYLAGPSFPKPELSGKLPEIKVETTGFETYLATRNSALKIKPDNESRIIWANDSLKAKTEYCLSPRIFGIVVRRRTCTPRFCQPIWHESLHSATGIARYRHYRIADRYDS